jgi:hypothetical protein
MAKRKDNGDTCVAEWCKQPISAEDRTGAVRIAQGLLHKGCYQ